MMSAVRRRHAVLVVLGLLALAACAETELLVHTAKQVRPDRGAPPPVGDYKVGKPYQIDGRWYYPAENYEYLETGIASWYGPEFHAKPTANGEIFNMNQLTAAHPTLPLPSAVRVTNLENGRAVVLRVNDRGPFARGRIIDISRRGAQLLGFERDGTAKVRVEILPDESRQLKLAALNRKGAADQLQVAASPREVVVARPLSGAGEGTQIASAAPTDTSPPRRRPAPIPRLPDEVEILPVSPTGIFVQAGAFARLENALRMRDRIYALGPTQISRFQVAGAEVYRVRIGPLESVAVADATLDRVGRAGIDDARLVVE